MSNATIVIPVYNEEEIIVGNTESLVHFLDKSGSGYEILICSNGSTDGTLKKGRFLEEKFPGKVRFFHLEKRGVGLAFEKMVKEASFNNIISVDMDLSIDVDFIPKCLTLLSDHSIVVGSKKLGMQKRSFFRLLASNTFIFLVKSLLGLDFHDYSIAAKGYRKNDIMERLSRIDHGSSYVIEIIYFVKQKGLRIIEIPVYCVDTRKSKFNIYNEVIYRFKNLLKLWFSERVL
jgi:glycosyltransferase involved in cell wall biosynthesis